MIPYAVILNDPNDEVRVRLESKYPLYRINDACYLVRSDPDAIEVIAKVAGIKGADQIEGASGVVFKLNRTHAGHHVPSLWDWLAQTDQL